MRPLLLLAAALSLAGCNNSCQQMCTDMAKFAEDCGYEWDKDDIAQCKEDWAAKSLDNPKNTKEYCNSVSGTIEDEWECDDLDAYFDNAGSGGGGGSDTGA